MPIAGHRADQWGIRGTHDRAPDFAQLAPLLTTLDAFCRTVSTRSAGRRYLLNTRIVNAAVAGSLSVATR
jgi:hypothetical protein